MTKDYFQDKAGSYELDDRRVSNVQRIAEAISSRIELNHNMRIMDFGSGTGLLLERIAPAVSHITAVDVSAAMNAQLHAKRESLACELHILAVDLCQTPLLQRFDGVISSMTFHHVEDIKKMFATLHALLEPGGFIAVADLESEDGSFHSEDTGVFHCGFDPSDFKALAVEAGFRDVETSSVGKVQKSQGDYPVFLLTARL